MAPSERRAKELAELEPPRSIERLLKFLDDYNRELQTPTMMAGSFGMSALAFSAGIAERANLGGLALGHMLARYSVTVTEVQEFVRWITLWNDKRTEIEVIPEPQIVFVTQVVHGPAKTEVVEYTATTTTGVSAISAPTTQTSTPRSFAATTSPPPPSRPVEAPTPTATSATRGPAVQTASQTRSGTSAVTESKPDTISRAWQEGRSPTPRDGFGDSLASANRAIWTTNLGLVAGVGGHLSGQADALRTLSPHQGFLVSQAAPSTEFVSMGRVFGNPEVEIRRSRLLETQSHFSPSPGHEGSSAPMTIADTPVGPQIGKLPEAEAALAGPRLGAPPEIARSKDQAANSLDAQASPIRSSPNGDAASPDLSPSQTKGFLTQEVVQRAFSQSPATWLAATAAGYLSTRVITDALQGLLTTGATGKGDVPQSDLFKALPGVVPGAIGVIASGASGDQRANEALKGSIPFHTQPTGKAGQTRGIAPLALGLASSLRSSPAQDAETPNKSADGRPSQGGLPEVHPLMGQITLVAPPMLVASEGAERSGAAVSIDWQTLAGGMAEVDESGLALLKNTLPPGYQAIYPALPVGAAGPSAVNLRIAPSLLQTLMVQGYGPWAKDLASRAAGMAGNVGPVRTSAKPLEAKLVPTKRPMGDTPSVLGDSKTSALSVAGEGQARRSGALDFMGMPIRLAPSLGGKSELADEVALRSGSTKSPSGSPLRPQQFAPLRERLFPSFQSVETEPDKGAWRKAAPSFGIKDDSPTSILSPDVRVVPPMPASPRPQSEGGSPINAFHSLSSQSPTPSFSIPPPISRFSPSRGLSPSLSSMPSVQERGPSVSVETNNNPFGGLSHVEPSSPAPISTISKMGVPSLSTIQSPSESRPVPRSPIGMGSNTPAPPARFAEQAPTPYHRSSPMTAGMTHLAASAPAPEPSFDYTPGPSRPIPRMLARQEPIQRPQANMVFHAAPAMPAPKPTMGTIQFSKGQSPVPAGEKSGKQTEVRTQGKDDKGHKSSDVNLMASEVWSILKRRLSSELDRQGRW